MITVQLTPEELPEVEKLIGRSLRDPLDIMSPLRCLAHFGCISKRIFLEKYSQSELDDLLSRGLCREETRALYGIKYAVLSHVDERPLERRVQDMICNHPSVTRYMLSRRLSCPERDVAGALSRLVQRKIITSSQVEFTTKKQGKKIKTVYRLR